MRIAYADPPYIGMAGVYPEKKEVDHRDLVNDLCADYDMWALSCHTPSLKEILSYCPNDVRIAAWVKPFCSFKPGVNPAYAWEPVVFWHARSRARDVDTVRDWLAESITMKKGLVGAKPAKFCYWIFELLGAEPTDDFTDLYPGTGIVGRCWESWKRAKMAEPEQLLLGASAAL